MEWGGFSHISEMVTEWHKLLRFVIRSKKENMSEQKVVLNHETDP